MKTEELILPIKVSKRNFSAFLWHAGFLAFAQSFMDVDTIIPSMLIESGGNAFHIGLMTAILLGGSSFTQILFAPYLSNKPFKKKFLLTGINARILSLLALGFILYYLRNHQSQSILVLIFFFITIFALSGAFANIGYIDILGKSINPKRRKKFFSGRQIINGSIVLISAFLAKQLISLKEYPINYAWSFAIGGTLLLMASLGFWRIKETVASKLPVRNIPDYFKTLKAELKDNKKLLYFLGFINTQGIAISFLPFVTLYAKQFFNAQNNDIGVFLFSKIIGMVAISLIILIYSGKIRYNLLLYLNVFLTVLLALAVLNIDNLHAFRYIFILGGIVFSLYTISMNGVLLEVSRHENRALYAGFAGAGNILPAIFPLMGGWFIEQWGFSAFGITFIGVVSLSVFFIYRMKCTH
ncbi:MAG: MFS transporter [Bacteroidota bacterium]|nr:MFS transporter [Bacteroidota bacterium]